MATADQDQILEGLDDAVQRVGGNPAALASGIQVVVLGVVVVGLEIVEVAAEPALLDA